MTKMFWNVAIKPISITESKIKDGTVHESKDLFIEGEAIHETTTRNNYTYTAEELEKSATTLMGKPILDSHRTESVRDILGLVTNAWYENGVVKFKAKIDSEEKDIQRKINKGFINNVSIGAAVQEVIESQTDPTNRTVKGLEFLELSLVAVPGDPNATIDNALHEAFEIKCKEEVEFKCEECGKIFSTKTAMDAHECSKQEKTEVKTMEFDVNALTPEQLEALRTKLGMTKEEAEVKTEESKVEAPAPAPVAQAPAAPTEEEVNKMVEQKVEAKLREMLKPQGVVETQKKTEEDTHKGGKFVMEGAPGNRSFYRI